MPKSFSEQERQYIISRLKQEAIACMELYGLRKTTVDELVKRVKIPKGTFYLFYSSKERLLFEVINDVQNDVQSRLLNELKKSPQPITADQLSNVLYRFYSYAMESGMLKIITSGELELLMRKLPSEMLDKHISQDDEAAKQLFAVIPNVKNKDPELFSAVFRALFLTALHQQEIGDNFEEALKILIKGVVEQWLK